jgi:hypothetical protein
MSRFIFFAPQPLRRNLCAATFAPQILRPLREISYYLNGVSSGE